MKNRNIIRINGETWINGVKQPRKSDGNIVIGGGIWINGVRQNPDFELSNRLVVNGVVYKSFKDFLYKKFRELTRLMKR